MNKIEIQQRVLQNGKPLDLSKFDWDEKTNTFSSNEKNLVLDFFGINDYRFNTGSNCTFKTGYDCTFNTGSDCTFKTGSNCTFKTGSDCTFNTGYDCTFNTGSSCIFITWSSCTFNTGYDCTFNTRYNCTFKTGSNCIIMRRDVFEVIQPSKGQLIQLCPYNIKGHLVDGKLNGVPHIIADNILSKIISKKGSVYKVVNHGEYKQTYLIEKNGIYSHGATLKQARDSLIYKISNRDTSAYKSMTIDTVLTKEEAIKCYITITGACASGTKYFVESQDKIKKKYKISEIIELTTGQFGNNVFKEFFKII